ncbi:vWA domain-containing protein [Bacillus infantis]|uniref:VWA domain-containing protein n=1 Tax=Bacillus infantis TaxID=324767 RepID=A0A5D4RAG2_9BACI|nr:VWA domain-containing protein [Bacillus infantis]TYS46602.1 VWA domain-containing protein [Bacillus infantis]
MLFFSPIYFLLGFFIIAFILFYFFRKQFDEKIIPSNMLWLEAVNEWQASPWLKKLQQNLLFWLQLLALLLLLFALVRPFWLGEELKGSRLILVVDPSASMLAERDGEPVFEKAREKMLSLAGSLAGQEVTLIRAGENPEILLSGEKEKAAVKKSINDLEITYEHENMTKALQLANSLADAKNSAIYIFSDGLEKEAAAALDEGNYTEVHNFGKEGQNLALLSFGVVREGEGIAGGAAVENQSAEEAAFSFRVLYEGQVLFEQEVEIEGNGQSVIQIPGLPEHPYYKAEIKADDAYQADNELTAIYNEPSQKVIAVGSISPFVLKGFETWGAELVQADPSTAAAGEEGIYLADAGSLEAAEGRPVIIFNAETGREKLEEPPVAADDPILEHVEAENIFIDSSYEPLKGDWETLLQSGGRPLIQKGTQNGTPALLINFALEDSDWPLQPGFPVFLYNAYQWLAAQSDFLGYFSPGEEKWLNAGAGSGSLDIYNDENENLYSLDLAKENFAAPYKPGVYQAAAGEEHYFFSVLLDDREKAARHASSFTMNDKRASNVYEEKEQNGLWFWLALFAFILIAAEWEVFRRGNRI